MAAAVPRGMGPRNDLRRAPCTDSDPEANPDEAVMSLPRAATDRLAAAPCRWQRGSLALAALLLALCAFMSLAAGRPSVAAGGDPNHTVNLWGIFSVFGGDKAAEESDENSGKDKDTEPTCESPKPLVTDPGPDGRAIEISASSEYTTEHDSAFDSRMDKSGWAAKETDMDPWLEWEFGGQDSQPPVMATIMKVQTLGRQWDDGQYITSYMLEYTEDGSHWKTHPTVFNGSQVWDKKAEAKVSPAFQARKVRMRLTGWKRHAAGKVELIGCFHAGKAKETASAAHTSGAHTSAASGAHTSAADTSVVPTSATSTSAAPAHTIATAITMPATATDNTDCAPDGWKWIYHPSSREWSYKKCTPNTAAAA